MHLFRTTVADRLRSGPTQKALGGGDVTSPFADRDHALRSERRRRRCEIGAKTAFGRQHNPKHNKHILRFRRPFTHFTRQL